MGVRPINGQVLVKPLEAEEQTAGGIYLPDTAKEQSIRRGEVIAVAEDATEEVAAGDRVLFSELSGTKIVVQGDDLVLLSSEDLLAKYVVVDEIPE